MIKSQLKKFIGKPCKTYWVDAVTYTNDSLERVKSEGFGLKESMAEIISIEKVKAGDDMVMAIILQSEKHIGDNGGDYTLIPLSWVTKVEQL